MPSDDVSSDMQESIEAVLAKAGYVHYETSAFCKPNSQSRHNVNYWSFGDYLGIGAGAHSKLSYHDKITREVRHKHPKAFMKAAETGNAVENTWEIGQQDLGFEFMMNALRLTDGFHMDLFQERIGLPLITIHKQLKQAEEQGLLIQQDGMIKPSLKGQRYLNDLLTLFLV